MFFLLILKVSRLRGDIYCLAKEERYEYLLKVSDRLKTATSRISCGRK